MPIISTQDSGITSTSFDSRVRSVSGYSLSTDPGSSVSRYNGGTATMSEVDVSRAGSVGVMIWVPLDCSH